MNELELELASTRRALAELEARLAEVRSTAGLDVLEERLAAQRALLTTQQTLEASHRELLQALRDDAARLERSLADER